MLFGIYSSILDTDNRIGLPQGLHEAYRHGVFITHGFDRNIMLLTMDAFEILNNKIKSLNITDPVVRLFLRMILGGAFMSELRSDGKILIPEQLKEFAGLEDDVVIVGQGDFAELWSPDAWKRQADQLLNLEANHFSTLNITIH